MKKIWMFMYILIGSLTLYGCSCTKMSAKDSVKEFLDQYKNLSASVLTDLENVISKENFSESQEETYRDILKKQYSDLSYEIIDETYDGDTAIVKTKIKVYDLYKVQTEAANYLTNNMNDFKDNNGTYDNSKFLDYKLDLMKKNTDTVEYTINFNLTKTEKDDWQINDLTNDDLEKIHGIYNYDMD